MDIAAIETPAPAWLPALQAELDAAVRRPFVWGEHDCVAFAARCWAARTGADPLAGVAWASEAEALAMLQQGGGLAALVQSRIGPPVAPLLAALGDVVLARSDVVDGPPEVLAVCVGQHLVAPGRRGLIVLPLQAGLAAWKAG